MPIGPIQKISDGDYEILFSSTFNVYEKKLIFENIPQKKSKTIKPRTGIFSVFFMLIVYY